MPLVMLRRDWNGTFRRTVTSTDGTSRVLQFSPGEVVEISAAEVPSLTFDLGRALQPVEWSAEKRKHVAIDLSEVDLSVPAEAAATSEATPPEETPSEEAATEPVADAPEKQNGPKAGGRSRR